MPHYAAYVDPNFLDQGLNLGQEQQGKAIQDLATGLPGMV